MKAVQGLLLWAFFACVCFGLGYPTLNRYDPRLVEGTNDAENYYRLVTGDARGMTSHHRFRVLVPAVARPFYLAAAGRIGTWDPVLFGLLCANSLFCATTLLILTALAGAVCGDHRRALVCALLYALNFNVANFQLAGLVDSGEAMFLVLIAWLAFKGQWRLLPLAAIGGALAKETFVPIATVFLLGWWLASRTRERPVWDRLGWTALHGLVGLAVVCALRGALGTGWVWPWDLAGAQRDPHGLLQGLTRCLSARSSWYPFFWLLPLGLWKLREAPRPWRAASAAGAGAALVLGAGIADAGGNTARPIFSLLGPILCLSAASLLTQKTGGDRAIDTVAQPD